MITKRGFSKKLDVLMGHTSSDVVGNVGYLKRSQLRKASAMGRSSVIVLYNATFLRSDILMNGINHWIELMITRNLSATGITSLEVVLTALLSEYASERARVYNK